MKRQRLTNIILAMTLLCLSNISLAHKNVVIIPILGDDDAPAPKALDEVYVAKANGDFTNLHAAMASIQHASASRPFTIIVAPGIYSLPSTLQLKPYVHIVGSGKSNTFIQASVSGEAQTTLSAMISGADHASIRQLSLENNTTSGRTTIAIFNLNTSPMIEDLDVFVSGSIDAIGLFNNNSSSVIKHTQIFVSATVNAYAVLNNAANVTLEDVTLDSSGLRGYGAFNNALSTVTIKDSSLSGNTNALFISGSSLNSRVYDSQILGPYSTPSSSSQCVFTYDESLQDIDC